MGQVIPFAEATQGDLQALQQAFAPDTSLVVSGGFPALSIKGGKFAITKSGDREVIKNPQTGDVASSLELCVIAYNSRVSKVFYQGKYTEGSTDAPDCYSNDGIKPAADAESPQCGTCAACPHNAWGSRITDDGKKAKACSDARRVAVAAPDQLNEPMLLRVPPTSMKPLGEYQKMLANRNLGLQAVVTKVSFDEDSSSPLLVFKPVGLCDADMLQEILGLQDDDTVKQIIGTEAVAYIDEHSADPAPTPEPQAEAKPAPKKAAKKPAAKAKPAPKKEPEPEPAPEPEAKASSDDDDLFSALDDVLGG